MDYKEYAERNGVQFPTGIHTRINGDLRVSSVYRRYVSSNFETWRWETILWRNERIENEYPSLGNAEEVINLHITILNEFI